MKRAPFLKWALTESLFVCLAITAVALYSGHVHIAGKIAVGVVALLFGVASATTGSAAWRGSGPPRVLDLSIRILPMLALLGTAVGFLIAFSGSTADVQQRVVGASTGLAATIAGIACTVTLMVQRELLNRPVGPRQRGSGLGACEGSCGCRCGR